MRGFITGVTGFAGSHLAEWLVTCGDQAAGSSSHGVWRADASELLRERVPLVACDLESASARQIADCLEAASPEVVYHLAAISVPADCGGAEMTDRCRQVNVEAVGRLIEAIALLPRPPRLVFASSSHVYGPVTAASAPVEESAATAPAGAYGRSKLLAERLILEPSRSGKVDAVIARAFHHAGPRQDARLMLSEWARQLVAGAAVVRVKRLDAWIDLSDVRDVAAAYRLLALHGAGGQIYNVGSGLARRTGDIFRELCQIAGLSPEVEEISPGAHYEPIADNRRLAAATQWRPRRSLFETLRDTLDYWRAGE